MYVFAKIRLKIEQFLLNNGFRCTIVSVKLLMFRANIPLDANTKILIITKLRR